MTFEELRQKNIALFAELKTNSNVLVIESNETFEDLSEDDKEWEISGIKEAYNLVLPEKMRELLYLDSVHICWHYVIDGRKETGGEFRLKRTQTIFVNIPKTAFADDLTPWGKSLYKEGYRFFDAHPNAGDGIFMAIKIENGTVADPVWYVDVIHEDMWPLELDYPQYIEHSLYLKGLYKWQYLFAKMNFRGLDFDISSLRRKLEDYPRLFPGYDVSEYLKRYKERGGE